MCKAVLAAVAIGTVLLRADFTPPPKPERYVIDHAGVLDAGRAEVLNEKLAQFERDRSTQILVYIDRRVPEGTTLEEFAVRAFETWGVGQKGKDNGAVLFLFIDDRAMRIEVGYGLEGALTDARSARIINEILRPALREGDFNAAVENGAEEMLAAARGEPFQGTGTTVAEQQGAADPPLSPALKFLIVLVGLSVLIIFVGVPAWIIYALYKAALDPLPRGKTFSTGASESISSRTWDDDSPPFGSWSSSSNSSSSSSSSSSFSGGGGRSGGGGASGSW